MPRGPTGVHAFEPGYIAVDGEIARASQHTPPLEDLSAAITESLPRTGVAGMLADLPMGSKKITGLAAGTDATDAITKAQLDDAIAALSLIPTGTVASFAGPTAPSGWLFCQGQAVSRTTYAALFAVIGTIYGAGNGTTTFNVPETRGEFERGVDAGRGADPGRTLGSLQSMDIQSHGHTATSSVNDPGHQHSGASANSYNNGGGANFPSSGNVAISGLTNGAQTGITVSTTVNATGGTETRPRNIAFHRIIKT